MVSHVLLTVCYWSLVLLLCFRCHIEQKDEALIVGEVRCSSHVAAGYSFVHC